MHVSTTWFNGTTFNFDPSIPKEYYSWVGRFEAQKDPILAVRTMIDICRSDPSAKAVMAGEGSMEPAVRSHVEECDLADQISFPGRISRVEVAELMRRSRATLLTSHYEGSPRVMFESLACGTPVVTTEGADPSRVISQGINGIVCARSHTELSAGLELASSLPSDIVARSADPYDVEEVLPTVLRIGTSQ
ncbi:glycosyltransferase [Rhodococcus sp. GXMU-t2271]|uniref:glycosyltransferase n=1 Tax=Rhodococcus sp. GXMU-t2271 TaxID=3059079 RepID=UPI00352B6CB2